MTRKTYSREEVIKKSIEYFQGDVLAAEVFASKYALRNEKQEWVEDSPLKMHQRLAKEFARIEKKFPKPISEDEIFNLLDHFKYVIPQGSPMFGIGNPYQRVSLSNCFVIKTVDSYGGICRTDERIVQISKRRGGCVEENSFVKIKDKGVIKIKDVEIGDKILSYNIDENKSEYNIVLDKYYTEVKKENQIKIKIDNGFEIRTSKTHPVLIFQNGKYVYKSAGELCKNDICIIPEKNIKSLLSFDRKLENIGWFIGAHSGDGSLGQINKSWNKKLPKGLRIRMLGDNENVVKKYAQICNRLTGSKAKYNVSRRKTNKTKCWEYSNNIGLLFDLAKIYFDNKIGRKCYDCHVFSFIEKNNLWLPYLAGLIDTDGHVKEDGMIDLCLCAKKIIYKISSVLSADGIRCHVAVRQPKRPNENIIYRLNITDENFYKIIFPYLRHEKKRSKLIKSLKFKRIFSHVYPFSTIELKNIIIKYNNRKHRRDILKDKKHANMMAIIALLKERGAIGLGGMLVLKEHNLLTQNKIDEILQRRWIKNIEDEKDDLKYIDISVKNNNNYYAGNIGLINIHNCGVDISPIRPKGVPTRNSAITTDGITVFMERFSNSSREVAQNGRRGALMQTISVHHPEILNFIRIKRDLKKVTGANISIRVTDEFMNAVKKDKIYEQRWPIDSDKPIISNKVRAKEIWQEMIAAVHLSGEPGILFWDNIIRNSPADSYKDVGFETISTNPCGELPLASEDACRLMVLNLSSYVKDPFTSNAKFDEELFKEHVKIAQRLMDDLVEMELEAIDNIIKKVRKDPEDIKIKSNELDLWKGIKEKCIQGRRTGLGVTGLADCIAMLNIKYGEKDSFGVVEKVYSVLRDEAYKSSIEMAKERGAFPIFDFKKEKDNEYLNRLPNDIRKDMEKHGRRNIGCLTTAPAGSVSTVTQTSSGFEPVFRAEYVRKRKLTESDLEKPDHVDELGDKWKQYTIVHHKLKLFKEITGKEFKDSPYAGAQSPEINYQARVKMQALATSYVDHAISSTVNLPSNIDRNTVSNLYMMAWEEGCKGLTIYRDGSREGVLEDVKSTRQCEDCNDASEKLKGLTNEERRGKMPSVHAPPRPELLECDIHKSKVAGGDWLFFVGLYDKKPYEVFGGDSEKFTIPSKYKNGWILKNSKIDGVTQYNLILGSLDDNNEKLEFKGITKHFNNYEYGAFTRLVSLTMRHGTPIKYICEQITKKGVEGDLFSFQRAMARILKKYISEGEVSGVECPICHSNETIYKGGCPTCTLCGHSNCT